MSFLLDSLFGLGVILKGGEEKKGDFDQRTHYLVSNRD